MIPQGFQEALIRQVNDLQELFGDGWDWVNSSILNLFLHLHLTSVSLGWSRSR